MATDYQRLGKLHLSAMRYESTLSHRCVPLMARQAHIPSSLPAGNVAATTARADRPQPVESGMIRSHVAAAIAVTAGVGFSFSPFVSSGPAIAETTEIKVLSAVVMKSALDDLARDFERTTGHKVTLAYAPAGAIRDRILGGEVFDLAILPRPIIDRLQVEGKIAPDSTSVIARSEVSVCVRAGAPKPDIGTR